MAEKWYLWQELLRLTSKNWVDAGNTMYQLYRDERFEPLVNSGRRLAWDFKLKALNPNGIDPHGL